MKMKISGGLEPPLPILSQSGQLFNAKDHECILLIVVLSPGLKISLF